MARKDKHLDLETIILNTITKKSLEVYLESSLSRMPTNMIAIWDPVSMKFQVALVKRDPNPLDALLVLQGLSKSQSLKSLDQVNTRLMKVLVQLRSQDLDSELLKDLELAKKVKMKFLDRASITQI